MISRILIMVAVWVGLLVQSSLQALAANSPDPLLPEARNWSLVFVDEFSGSVLDPQKWVTCYWWADDLCTNAGNKEMQLYSRQNVHLKDGKLVMRADFDALYDAKGRLYPFGSGMITSGIRYSEKPSPSRFAFQYGYVEVRAKSPAGKGLWSALWLLPDRRVSRPEIDIMEVLGDSGDKFRMHIHYRDTSDQRRSVGETLTVDDVTDVWQVYGLLWQPDRITWYLNGKAMWSVTDRQVIPTEKLYFLANLAVGGEWPGAPDESTRFPADFLLDYVRIWQKP